MESDIPVSTNTQIIAPDTLLEGRFRIVSLIASGGMATVYLAEHQTLQEKVAVKILDRGLTESGTELQRFKHEAKTLQRIAHRNVVRVHSFGLTDGKPYMVMEYIDGKPLDKELKENGRLELNRVLAIFKEVCAGLQAAHDEQIMHRDLKPSNILLANDCVKLVDFGIAKPTSASQIQQQYTATGVLTGTPLYMSPERCKSLPEDSRSDIYSLGCVLFECLTGQPPFSGESPLSVLSQQLNDEATVPAQFRATSPIWAVVRRCMAKKPEGRYASAAELAAALSKIETGEEPDPLIKIPAQYKSSPPTVFYLIAGLLVVCVFCIGTIVLDPRRSTVAVTASKASTPTSYYHQFSTKTELPPRPNDVSKEYYSRVAVAMKGAPAHEQTIMNVGYSNKTEHAFLNFALANYFAHRATQACEAGNYDMANGLFADTFQKLSSCPQSEILDLALADVLTREANMYLYTDRAEEATPVFSRALKHLRNGHQDKDNVLSAPGPQREFNLAITQASYAANLYKRASLLGSTDERQSEFLKAQARENVENAENILDRLSKTFPVSQAQLRESESLFERLFPAEIRAVKNKDDRMNGAEQKKRVQNRHYKKLRKALRSFTSEVDTGEKEKSQ
ncbi:MAG: serine/threonine protein kinase [Candidatus Obscuribacterales bacterium]|nr:serine/threonine protein kinase [Candidatus Obscuribacterales bacterium]